jgi:hypothetical protein
MHENDVGRRLDPPDDDRTERGAARERDVRRRDAGVRRTRQISSWTAAALVAGVAAGSGYFAHAAAMPTVSTNGSTGQGVVGRTGQKPSLTHPVITSGGSGVTVGTAGGAPGSVGGTVQGQDN